MYTSKLITKATLGLAIFSFFNSHANATEQEEIKALRAEVAELRALIKNNPSNIANNLNDKTNISTINSNSTINIEEKVKSLRQVSQGLKLVTANGSKVELYGFLRGDAAYITEGTDNIMNGIPTVGLPQSQTNPIGSGVKNKLNTSATLSRIGLNFTSNLSNEDKIGGKLEADFSNGPANSNNTNGGLRIRHAYLTYNDWLFGQTKSNFLGYSPEMVDAGTNVGTGYQRVPMVRYSHNVAPSTQILFSLERGQSSGDNNTTTTSYKLPTLTARLNQSFANNNGLLTVRGLAENYEVKKVISTNSTNKQTLSTKSATGLGLGLGLNYKINKNLELFSDVNYIKGNNGLIYGTTNAYATINNGEVYQNSGLGWMVGSVINITPKLRSTIGYSELNFDRDNDYAKSLQNNVSALGNKKLHSLWGNLIYSPVQPIDLGIEYQDGKRETFNGQSYKDNRISMMAAYKF